jgi:hypothetical protein
MRGYRGRVARQHLRRQRTVILERLFKVAAHSRARQPSTPRSAARHCHRRLELTPPLALAAGQPLH